MLYHTPNKCILINFPLEKSTLKKCSHTGKGYDILTEN